MFEQFNSCYFKENEVLDSFETFLNDILNSEQSKNLFNNTEFFVSSEYNIIADDTPLPIVFVKIDDAINDSNESNSSQIQQYTRFSLSFEIFTKEIGDLPLFKSATAISEFIIHKFQQKYGCMILTQNRSLPNLDISIARRLITFGGRINNQTNRIYSL